MVVGPAEVDAAAVVLSAVVVTSAVVVSCAVVVAVVVMVVVVVVVVVVGTSGGQLPVLAYETPAVVVIAPSSAPTSDSSVHMLMPLINVETKPRHEKSPSQKLEQSETGVKLKACKNASCELVVVNSRPLSRLPTAPTRATS